MRSRVYETAERPSVRLSVPSIDSSSEQRRAAGLLLSAVREWTVAGADAQQQRRRNTTFSSKCGQCHIDSRGTRLNTDYTLAY